MSTAYELVRLHLVSRAPYYADVVYRVRVSLWSVGTLGVTRDWQLMYDPEVSWSLAEYSTVLEHELNHLLREHAARGEGPRWNIAGDLEINDDLAKLPQGALTPASVKLPAHQTAEWYDAHLPRTRPVCCGSGAGHAHPDEAPPSGGGAPGDVEQRAVRLAVARAALAAGDASASLKRWAEQYDPHPPRSWERELSAVVRRALDCAGAGTDDQSWARPRRHMPEGDRALRPGWAGRPLQVALVVDTSGSMAEEQLAVAVNQIPSIVAAAGAALTVYSVDAAVHGGAQRRITRAGQVTLTGGGGTDMGVGLAAALTERPRPNVVIVLTDGQTPWPVTPPTCPVIVGVIGPQAPTPPSWARSMVIG